MFFLLRTACHTGVYCAPLELAPARTNIYTGVTMRTPLLLLCLLWSLVKVHSQTAPYVSFMGETLPNHPYVDLSLVGSSGSDSVQCHTDLNTCCTGTHGVHRGDWIAPGSETRLPFLTQPSDIYEVRGAQKVDLRRRNNADMPSGIYRCDIPTNAVHDDDDLLVRESVYVGLYATGGNQNKTLYYCVR